MNRFFTKISIAGVVALASGGAMAQSPAPVERPKAIGTSQSTADEANRKAVQDGNAATVVRTGPSAVDKANDAVSSTTRSMKRKKAKPTAKAKQIDTDLNKT